MKNESRNYYFLVDNETGFLLYPTAYENKGKAKKDLRQFGSKKYGLYKVKQIELLRLMKKTY